MKTKTVFRTVNVSELKDRWLWRERGVYRSTAAQMLKLIKSENKKSVRSNEMLISTIEWHTKTMAGAAVVKALTDPFCAVSSKKL